MVFEEPQNLPYMVYGEDAASDFSADNQHYYKINNYWLEYYSKTPSVTDEARIEEVFKHNDIPYSRQGRQYLDGEKMFICVYDFQLGE